MGAADGMNDGINHGINDGMNDEQRQFFDAADRWVAQRLKARDAAGGAAADTPGRTWAQLADMGWLAVGLPEACGGYLGVLDMALLFERAGRAGLTEPLLDNLALAGPLLAQHGDAAQQALVGQMVQGQARFAWAVNETAARHDWWQVATTLDDQGRLTGAKQQVAASALSTHVLVLAREAREAGDADADADALTAVLLPLDRAGLTWRHYLGYDDHPLADLTLQGVAVTAGDIVGQRGGARTMMDQAFDRGCVALAAEAAGAMQRVLDLTLAYANTRKQFGRTLASNQAYQHQLVDLYVAVEEQRALALHAAEMLALHPAAAARWASAAKAYASSEGRWAGEVGVQLHGAIGMTSEYPVGGCYKRLAAIANQWGDAEWHGLRLRELDRSAPAS